jgi:hypothetical protein
VHALLARKRLTFAPNTLPLAQKPLPDGLTLSKHPFVEAESTKPQHFE